MGNHLIILSSDYRTIQGLRWNDTPCSFETFFVCEVWKCCANCAKLCKLCKLCKRVMIKKVQKRSGWEGRLPKVCKNRELRLIKVAFFKKWPLSDWTFTWSCEKILVKENKLLNSCFYNELQDNGARLVEELRKIKIYPHPIRSCLSSAGTGWWGDWLPTE